MLTRHYFLFLINVLEVIDICVAITVTYEAIFQSSVTMLSWMTDEFMRWPKPYFLLSTTGDEILSRMIETSIGK